MNSRAEASLAKINFVNDWSVHRRRWRLDFLSASDG